MGYLSDRVFFEETRPVYRLLNQAMRDITENEKGFYESIFTSGYEELEYDDQNLLVGVIQGDYGLEIKDIIDCCIEEKVKEIKKIQNIK